MLAACRVEHELACGMLCPGGAQGGGQPQGSGLALGTESCSERSGMCICFILIFQLVFSKIRIRHAHVCRRIGLLQCIQSEPQSLSRSGAAPDKTCTSLWTRVELPFSQGGR